MRAVDWASCAGRGYLGQADADAAIVTALVVDLEYADLRRGAGRGEMRAAASLAVQSRYLDDADLAVRRGRRRHRSAADEAVLRLRLLERDIVEGDGDMLR